jgi:hypothetical protein
MAGVANSLIENERVLLILNPVQKHDDWQYSFEKPSIINPWRLFVRVEEKSGFN